MIRYSPTLDLVASGYDLFVPHKSLDVTLGVFVLELLDVGLCCYVVVYGEWLCERVIAFGKAQKKAVKRQIL